MSVDERPHGSAGPTPRKRHHNSLPRTSLEAALGTLTPAGVAPRVAAARSDLDADRARRAVAVAVALVHGGAMRGAQVHALLVAAHGPGAGAEPAATCAEAGTHSVAYGRLVPAAPVGPPDLYRSRLIDTDTPAKQGAQGAPARSLRAWRRDGPTVKALVISSKRYPSDASP